jgi:hypothetical protein
MGKHGVDGVAEINAGIDECAIEIERDETRGGEEHWKSLTEKGQRRLSLFIPVKSGYRI